LAVALLACAALAGCGAGTPAARDGAGAARARAFERALTDNATASGSPAVAAAVVARGRLVWSGASGMADVAMGRAMTPRTPVYFGSVSKMITAAVALHMQERGLLRLDDPVGRWVPQWRGPRRVTLRSLLSQTSGVHDPGPSFFDAIVAGRLVAPADWLAHLPAPDRRTRPEFEYANANYILAGIAMRRAARTQWAAVRHEVAPTLALQPDERVRTPGVVSYPRESLGGAPTA
jgi:CubicO group peptidase (beta-lactamase class C family)